MEVFIVEGAKTTLNLFYSEKRLTTQQQQQLQLVHSILKYTFQRHFLLF